MPIYPSTWSDIGNQCYYYFCTYLKCMNNYFYMYSYEIYTIISFLCHSFTYLLLSYYCILTSLPYMYSYSCIIYSYLSIIHAFLSCLIYSYHSFISIMYVLTNSHIHIYIYHSCTCLSILYHIIFHLLNPSLCLLLY